MGTVSKLPGAKEKKETAKSLEDRFIEQYVIDRDPIAAALRAGVPHLNLKRVVERWMKSQSVQQKIQDATDNADIDTMITPQRIIAGFIDVAFNKNAPDSARNAALRELASLKKMYPDKDPDKNKKYAKNVMFVPAQPALDDWEKAATNQQAKLREEVRK